MPPTTPDMLMRRAARHHLAGQLREAAALYRKLLQDNPQHGGALHALGVMAHQTGRVDAAEKLLLRAVATDPELAAGHDDLGALWLLQGKLEQAAAAFTEAVRVDPGHALAHAHLGAALLLLGRAEASAVAYQHAVDTAVASFRRLRTVSIDVRPVTDALAAPKPAEPVTTATPVLAGEPQPFAEPSAEVSPAEASPIVQGIGAAGDDDEPSYTLTDDEEDDGVVGLTLVPPSAAAGLPSAMPIDGQGTFDSEHDVSALAARAEAVGLAYASIAQSDVWRGLSRGWWDAAPAGAHVIDRDTEPAMAMAGLARAAVAEEPLTPTATVTATVNGHRAVAGDGRAIAPHPVAEPVARPPIAGHAEPTAPWLGAAEVSAGVHAVPMVEAVVGDPRYDAPHAMMLAAPTRRQAATPLANAGVATGATELAAEPPVPGPAIEVVPLADETDSFTLAAPPAAPEVGETALDPLPLELEQETAMEAVEAAERPTTTDEAAPDVILPPEPLPGQPQQAEPTVVRPAPATGVRLPPSAALLADDPVMAPRQLSKELRRARRKPVPDARTAASLQKQGTKHLRQRRVEEAIAALQRLVELQPSSAKAHRDLGAAYIRADRLDEAAASLTRALELRPRFADAFASLGDVYHLQGRVEDAINCYRQTLTLRPTAASAHSNLLLTMNYQRKTDTKALFDEHVKWGRTHAAPLARDIAPFDNDPTPDRQIRIGYVSGDFRRHAVGSFIEPVLAHRDAKQFHVICYSDVLRPDDATERLSAMCDGWRDIRGLSDADVAEMVRHDQIDILVDLAGHTGTNRLCMFARKPAPVQVTYLGYPNTTGVPTMDYRITDAWADPLGQTEQFHTEQLYRLPRGFLCYQPPADAPVPVAPPVASNGYVTFGCFNILAKLTPETLGLWAKIMTVLPKSRIVLKDRLGTFASASRRRHVHDIFAYHRIAVDRVELLDREPDRTKHLESYGKVDIMLDPFPYNGTTTTCEALWMGVPVITLAGTRHASRVGVSILKSAGLPEFIAANVEAYARSAVLLGRDVNRLALLRKTLRQKVAASALTEGAKFAQVLGVAYREMWSYWCQTRGRPMLPAAES